MLTDLDIPSRYDDERPSDRGSLVSSHHDPFDLLATEIIEEIFSYTCPDVDLPASIAQEEKLFRDSNSDPAILSRVSKRWHAIAMGNHLLWTSITIHMTRIDAKDWARWGFLQLQSRLKRSGAHPLNIRVQDDIGNGIEEEVIDGILDIVTLHSKRWRSIALAFFVERDLYQKLNTLIDRLPLLEHLEVEIAGYRNSEDTRECTAFLSAPRLKSLCITIPEEMILRFPRKFHIPRTQISELIFSSCNSANQREFQEMLECISVSLTALTFLKMFENDDWVSTSFSRNIRLPKLRRLRLLEDCITALDMLICPSLQELEIFNGEEHIITSFLDHSSCSLTHFKLCSLSNYRSITYEAVLKHSSLSTLRSISLAEITDRGLHLLNFDFFQLLPLLETLNLYLRITRHREFGPQQLLHRVEQLRKVIESRTHTMPLDPSESLVHGPQATEVQWVARSSLKKCRFHFNVELDGPVIDDYWDEEPIAALQSFCISQKILVSLKTSYSWKSSMYSAKQSSDGDLGIDWDLKFP